MSTPLLAIYHRLPSAAQSVVASMRGYHLRQWRYGPETEELVAQCLERDSWNEAQWKTWREERLGFLLHRAATRVPFYRDMWARRRQRGDTRSWEELANWPILRKDSLRQHAERFVADDCVPSKMFKESTSGTTGSPINLYFSRDTVRAWYAIYEARCRRWYGVSRQDRWGILGGQLVVPVQRRRPPFWVWNAGMRQLYLSSYHLAPDLIPQYLDAIRRYRVRYLLGYTSALYSLAREILREGYDDLPLSVVITNAEPLLDHQRDILSRAFRCPVRETYGMCELAAAASECSHGTLHWWPSVGVTEVLQQGEPVSPGQAGELVATGLVNGDMPLVRYRVGDRVREPAQTDHDGCPCGRRLPILANVEGRTDDVLYTVDGRQVGRLDPVFKSAMPVRETQIIQESVERIRVKVVPTSEFEQADADSIANRLRDRVGPVTVIVERVDTIPRSANGKFRAVVCQIPAAELPIS